MSASSHGTSGIILWASRDQLDLVRSVIDAMPAAIVAAGGPTADDAAELSQAFDAMRVDDIRLSLQHEGARLIWLACRDEEMDEHLPALRKSGLPLFSSEPRPADILTVTAEPAAAGERSRLAPRMRMSPGFEAAMHVLEDFGDVQCVNLFFRSGRGEGTLLSRLYDAMDIVERLCGEAESITASLAGPLPETPETIRGLAGHMTVNLTFADRRCACIAASDSAGAWFRGVTILGPSGCIRIDDQGFEWIDASGKQVDQHRDTGDSGLGALIARQFRQAVEQQVSSPPTDHTRLLALCEAGRLSCRTGQTEQPAKMLEMMLRP